VGSLLASLGPASGVARADGRAAVRAVFLQSMKDAPVTQLPRQPRRRVNPTSHIAEWDNPDLLGRGNV
jgi:hypothetical protein